jgi:DNA polymerase I-like protein with 3'-5' exonuclease and polymerase domains
MVVVSDLNGNVTTYLPQTFTRLIKVLEKSDLWITFNGKFDMHWIRRELGIVPKSVWDCQLAEFLFSNQTWKYPSLDESCAKRGLPQKLDIVKTEYWDKGIDTCDIPYEILKDYAIRDAEATLSLFYEQVKLFEGEHASKYKLFRAHCNDLIVLQEIEYNGILYDVEGSIKAAKELEAKIETINDTIKQICNLHFPFNFDSRQQISKLLYGGVIEEEFTAPIGVYKTGTRAGQVKMKKFIRGHHLERMVEPLQGSEMKAEGVYATDEETLTKLKATGTARKMIKLLLERAKIAKLNSTYLRGLPNVIEKQDCQDNIIHSNLNQCVVVSGRLSSTKPNIQNQPPEAKQFCISRF